VEGWKNGRLEVLASILPSFHTKSANTFLGESRLKIGNLQSSITSNHARKKLHDHAPKYENKMLDTFIELAYNINDLEKDCQAF
jgi:hypothetical protein